MNAPRSAAFLRSAATALSRMAARLDPPRRSMADECEAMRRELEAEAQAEFGVRNVEFTPDPASPGDVWPRQCSVTPLTRKLRRAGK